MKKDQRGQSMVETALLLPVFFLILSGILDFGKVMYSYSQLQTTAQESVRLAGLGETDQQVTAFAKQYESLGDPSKLIVSFNLPDTKRNSGDYVTVTLSYPFVFLTPMVSKFFPSAFSIQTSSTTRVE